MFMRLTAVFVLSAVALACSEQRPGDTANSPLVAPTSIQVATAGGTSSSASGGSPSATTQAQAAETSTETQRVETTGGFLDLCNGDTVEVAGTFNQVFHTTINGNNVLFGLHQTGGVTGTSQTTGARYIWNSSFQVSERTTLVNGATTLALVEHNRFIALGSAASFNAKLLIHVTINANGDVTTDFQFVRESCVG